jgi:hypothetical protein
MEILVFIVFVLGCFRCASYAEADDRREKQKIARLEQRIAKLES